jgi:hypothetical protein
MDTAPAGSVQEAWLRNPGRLPAAAKHDTSKNFTHGTPGPSQPLARYKLLIEAYAKSQPRWCPGWAWRGL